MATMTLKKALDMFDGEILSDGAQNWDQENYLEAIYDNADDPENELAKEVYVSEDGIFAMNPEGYIGKAILTVVRNDA